MSIVCSYEEWKKRQLKHLRKLNEGTDCPDCWYGFTECCECGQDQKCERCEGEGVVKFKTLKDYEIDRVLKVDEYVKAAAADIHELCAFTGKDFLATVGRFISDFRMRAAQ